MSDPAASGLWLRRGRVPRLRGPSRPGLARRGESVDSSRRGRRERSLGGGQSRLSLTGLAVLWSVQAVLDALRAGGWLLFLCVLLQGTRAGLKAAALPIALPAAAWFFYPEGFQATSRLAFGALLACRWRASS